MTRIDIKPLSVNQAWQGRRYKTPCYKRYERDVLALLPSRMDIPGRIALELEVGLSNRAADIDNPIKPFVDLLQKKYHFNDRNIYKLIVRKVIVKRGQEYIKFEFKGM